MRSKNRQACLIKIYLYIHLSIGIFPVRLCAEHIHRDPSGSCQFINILFRRNLGQCNDVIVQNKVGRRPVKRNVLQTPLHNLYRTVSF